MTKDIENKRYQLMSLRVNKTDKENIAKLARILKVGKSAAIRVAVFELLRLWQPKN